MMMSKDKYMQSEIKIAPLQKGLHGEAVVPGDKSISHRGVILGSLAQGKTHLHGLLEGEDVLSTIGVMRQLGAHIERCGLGTWVIDGLGDRTPKEPDCVLDMGNSGTSARLLSGVLGTCDFVSFVTGDRSLRRRPMGRVIEPLREMGVDFLSRSKQHLPMAIIGTNHPKAVDYKIKVPSAQVKSSLILAALSAQGVSTFIEPILTRDHTENMVPYFGGKLSCRKTQDGAKEIKVEGGHILKGRDVNVPADPSSAAFVAVAAVITENSAVTIPHVGLNPMRGEVFQVLKEMGADITITDQHIDFGEAIGTLHVRSSNLHAVEIDAKRAPALIDEYPILSVAASFAHGVSRFCGLGELRVKESDRFAAIVTMLQKNNVDIDVQGDDLIIKGCHGNVRGGGMIQTHHDHRLAMSASILGLASQDGLMIDDVSCIGTSFPGYTKLMNHLGAGLTFKC